MDFLITDSGTAERVAARLEVSGEAAIATRPVMEEITLDMLRIEKIVFSSQGRRGGGSWKPLKQETIDRKGSSQILRDTDALYRSLTEPEAEYQVLSVTRDSVLFGTDRPHAGIHQRGSRTNPARPFLRFLPTDVNRWKRQIARHVLGPLIPRG